MSAETVIHIATLTLAFGSVIGLLFATTVLIRCMAEISSYVYRITNLTFDLVEMVEEIKSTHGVEDSDPRDRSRTCQSTSIRRPGEF